MQTQNPGVKLVEGDGTLHLHLPQGEFGVYHYGENVVRPFIWPLLGPGQTPVTREVKLENDDEADHPHHRSLFTAYEEANDANNWNELEGHGYTRHQEFLDKESNAEHGGFCARGFWTNKNGDPVLTEERRVRLYDAGEDIRLLDYEVTLVASHGDVTFGETKEAGILGLRVAPSMNGSAGGVITNSEGGRGESECWGKKAAWCDYSGSIGDEIFGIAVFDHPSNPNYPTRWHVRDYGLFATNPFATAAFNAGEPSPFVLKEGESATFCYRVIIHRDYGDASLLQQMYEEWTA
jgi:hypothetical protein